MKHLNNGNCPMCEAIINRYAGFHPELKKWFQESQEKHPEMHTSCAGRGQIDQEACVIKKVSKAPWKQSGHNWNAALDLFEMQGSPQDIYERDWFDRVLAKLIPDWLEWYGAPGAAFPELPHVQVKNWQMLASNGTLKLVE